MSDYLEPEQRIAAALFSGEYDHLTVGEFAAKFAWDIDPPVDAGPPTTWKFVDCPVVDGVATLPDGSTVRSSSAVVRVPVVVR
jgi:hypothetical protein